MKMHVGIQRREMQEYTKGKISMIENYDECRELAGFDPIYRLALGAKKHYAPTGLCPWTIWTGGLWAW
jgi:hypothetical protein